MSEQFILPFKENTQEGPINFFTTESNVLAHKMISLWPQWPSFGLFIHGARGSGKTHLAKIWQQMSHAILLDGSRLHDADVETIVKTPRHVIIDNFTIQGGKKGTRLFHLFNAVKNGYKNLLIMSRCAPQTLLYPHPDLKSRILSLIDITIQSPDDQLREAIFFKRFSDMQLQIDAAVIKYLIAHSERSYESIQDTCDKIQRATFTSKKPVTIPLIKELLTP